MFCHFKDYLNSPQPFCVKADLSTVSFQAFWQDVAEQTDWIRQQPTSVWALWEQDSYEFLVLFFAALNVGKKVILPPHRVRELEQELEAQDIFFLQRSTGISEVDLSVLQFDEVFLNDAHIEFYTSGSTGQAKAIPRTLQQLFNEVTGLEASFQLPQSCIAIATVSHQHIYGLLFKLLWPLACGRSFYQKQLAFPEDVVDVQQQISHFGCQNYVISSPALLKRWTSEVRLEDCVYVYSSGGKLDSGVRPDLNRPIIEVLGSSETGGIAHRQADDLPWTPFHNVEVKSTDQDELAVKTNHAYSQDWILTGDRVKILQPQDSQSSFQLFGRLDRIVKLEEKRLSLDAIERSLMSLPEIEQCYALVIEKDNRQMLAVVVKFSTYARQILIREGKAHYVRQLKSQLVDKLESIAIPRQWRFLSEMPQNAQSKLNKQYLASLFAPLYVPVILSQRYEQDEVHSVLEMSPELMCFKGHFPNHPIYPGVGQIGFIQYFAKQHWAELKWCSGFEQLKFQDLIRPFDVLDMTLRRQASKVSFELKNNDKIVASGRLNFMVDTQIGVE